MSATVDDMAAALADYVGAPTVTEYLRSCVTVAQSLVAQEAKDCTGLPEDVSKRAVLEVAAELFHRRNAPNGIKSFGDLDSAASMRVARDALVAARPLLAAFRTPLVFS